MKIRLTQYAKHFDYNLDTFILLVEVSQMARVIGDILVNVLLRKNYQSFTFFNKLYQRLCGLNQNNCIKWAFYSLHTSEND